jgi:phage gpG-like protein
MSTTTKKTQAQPKQVSTSTLGKKAVTNKTVVTTSAPVEKKKAIVKKEAVSLNTETTVAIKKGKKPVEPLTSVASSKQVTSASTKEEQVVGEKEGFWNTIENEMNQEYSEFEKEFASFASEIRKLETRLNQMKSMAKVMHKNNQKRFKNLSRPVISMERKKAKKTKRDGFSKPEMISNELEKFLKSDCQSKNINNSMIARNEVTKFLTKYITENDLKDKVHANKINPDEKLKRLLSAQEDDVITWSTIHKYTKHHYINTKKSQEKN